MQRLTRYGGLIASVILIAIGIGVAVGGVVGRAEVRDNLAREQIVGTPDSEIAGQRVDTGSEARKFADTIRRHTLEATDGKTYAQMPRFMTEDGEGTDDEAAALKDDEGRPVENELRNMWVTATALTTALNTAYFAEQVALFSIVMGIALVLAGIGFLVLTLRALGGRREGRGPVAVP